MAPRRLLPALAPAALLAVLFAPPAFAQCEGGATFGGSLPMTTGANPLFMVVADFDADGADDLAVTNSNYLGGGSAGIAVLRGTGLGAFGAPTVYASGVQPHGLVTADFNGDGALDLAFANRNSGTIGVLLGQLAGGAPTGTFVAGGSFPAGGLPFQLVTGHYDGDGILDLAVALNDVARIVVMRGLGSGGVGNGTFGTPLLYNLAQLGRAIAQGDFNGDGILDLVASEYVAGTVAVFLGRGAGGIGDGSFAPAVHYPAGPEPTDIEVFDYDENGTLDLAIANGTSAGVRVLRGNGNGTFTLQNTLAGGNTGCVLALDVDADGVMDLVNSEVALPVGRRLHVWRGVDDGNNAGTGGFVAATPILLASEPYQLAAARTNGDKYPELLASLYNTSDVVLLSGGCQPAPPDPRNPVLTRVRDVPADEGGRVYLTWLRSSLDAVGGTVTSYRVWRQIPDEAGAPPAEELAQGTAMARTGAGPDGETLVTYWESLATLPAERLEGYGYTAATTEDSSRTHPVSTAFFVSALTANINVSYPSNIRSGASIDNLPPGPPQNVRLAEPAGGAFRFAWSPNAEPDFGAYHVHRSASADFPEGGTTWLGAQTDTVFADPDAADGAFYRVVAVDRNDNESAASQTIARGTVSAGAPGARLALAGPWPNPGRAGQARLVVELPADGPARLEVFDAAGRRVAAPSLAGLGRGRHAVRLGEDRPLAPGAYWLRLSQGARRVGHKLVMGD